MEMLVVATLSDHSGHWRTLWTVLGGEHADVVLDSGTQALQQDGGLIRSKELLQGVSSLVIGWSACHSVASDAWKSGEGIPGLLIHHSLSEI